MLALLALAQPAVVLAQALLVLVRLELGLWLVLPLAFAVVLARVVSRRQLVLLQQLAFHLAKLELISQEFPGSLGKL